MNRMLVLIIAVLALMLFCGSALAQRSGPQFRRPLACEPLEPRTKLEDLETRYERVITKGFTRYTTLRVSDVEIRLDAVEMKDTANSSRAIGFVVALRELGERPHENRSFVDYEEIDRLIKGMEAASKVNETMSKLAGFEARYRTLGDLEIIVFRHTRSGIAASVTSGICDQVTANMTLDELDKLRGYLIEAKGRLDEIK